MVAVPLLGGWDTITRTGSILPDGTLRTEKTLHINQVGAEYFRTLGTRLLAGHLLPIKFTRSATQSSGPLTTRDAQE